MFVNDEVSLSDPTKAYKHPEGMHMRKCRNATLHAMGCNTARSMWYFDCLWTKLARATLAYETQNAAKKVPPPGKKLNYSFVSRFV